MPNIKHRFTKEQCEKAVAENFTLAGTLKSLGLTESGGSYGSLHRHLKTYSIDTSHFLGQAHFRGQLFGHQKPITHYLVNGKNTKSHTLKLRLLKEGIFEHKCYRCKGAEWRGGPIPIELNHKDGNHLNNELANLEILCPNCHAQEPTNSGKNKKLKRLARENGRAARTRTEKLDF